MLHVGALDNGRVCADGPTLLGELVEREAQRDDGDEGDEGEEGDEGLPGRNALTKRSRRWRSGEVDDFDAALGAWPPRLMTEIVADGDVAELVARLDRIEAWAVAERARRELSEDWLAESVAAWRSARDQAGRTLLMIAIAARHAAMIPILVQRGARLRVPPPRELADPFGPWGGSRGLYHFAATSADVATLEALRPYDDPRATDEAGVTALHYAAHAGRDELFAWFVAAGVAVDALDAYGCTALNYAATKPNAVAALLGLGASPDGGPGTDAPTWMRGRPLSLALRSSPECFELLLEAGADISWVPDACETAARRPAVLARLIARGSVPTARALREAVRDWHFESVGLLLDAARFEEKDLVAAMEAGLFAMERQKGRHAILTPAYEAILRRFVGEPSCSGGAATSRGSHALLRAAAIDREDVVAALLAMGIAIDGTVYVDHPLGGDGGTALHVAAARHATHAARVLLAAGASVEAVDRAGRRPFEVAAESAAGPARKALLELLMVRDEARVASKSGFEVGAFVTHAKFGEGVVEKVEGEGDNTRLTISFGEGRKTLLARFVTQRFGGASR